MKKTKLSYQAPVVKVVSFMVEGGFGPSIDQASSVSILETHGESTPKYGRRYDVSFGNNDGQYF